MSFSNSGRFEGGRENHEHDHRQKVTDTIIRMLDEGRPARRNTEEATPLILWLPR